MQSNTQNNAHPQIDQGSGLNTPDSDVIAGKIEQSQETKITDSMVGDIEWEKVSSVALRSTRQSRGGESFTL